MTETCKAYAEALFTLALEEGKEREFLDSLKEISALLSDNQELFAFLKAPNIPFEAREEVLAQVLSDMHDYISSFFMLLCKKGFMASFDSCVEEYQALLNAKDQVVKAKVTTAIPLTEKEESELKAKLEKISKKKVVLTCVVDGSIMGGVLIEMDGKRMDGTLRHRLTELKGVLGNE